MHDNSITLINRALLRYGEAESASVLDVGSRDVNGTYRPLIEERGWSYTGLDVEYGPNVDVVTDNPYRYPFKTGQFDIVISGSVAYLVLDLVSWVKELVRVTRPGGLIAVVTPSYKKPHAADYPDYWRMTDEALQALFENTGAVKWIETCDEIMDVSISAFRVETDSLDGPKTAEAEPSTPPSAPRRTGGRPAKKSSK